MHFFRRACSRTPRTPQHAEFFVVFNQRLKYNSPLLKPFKCLVWIVLVGCGLVASASAQDIFSNTVVRFHISTGERTLGDVDVELFAHDKPETVRNFLLYVRNGSYNQVLLHRLAPLFVLQGGGFKISDPASGTNLFSQFNEIMNLGAITNEFGVGPRLSNTVGTIAMAKVGTNANSATSQWFFNLTNNAGVLDTSSGGFTVFGRVLAPTNEVEATNVLDTFNARSQGNGIVNLAGFFGQVWSAFSALPVDYSGSRVPQTRELFYVTVSELNGPAEPDTNAPAVAVTSPEAVVTNATVTLSGTASDDRGVARVIYFFGDTTPRVATGTTNWSAALTLAPGTNVVRVQSVDEFGNTSAMVERTITYYIPPNTMVRFHISTGEREVGDVDVELFDREKPETVRNFLLYVRNGSYNQVLLHRLVPGFVLQGGGFTNSEPAESANLFSQFGDIKNLGPITNEFAVGQRLSNTVGTIAMAKLGNNPNSASSQWFFNLSNNVANLDTQNGGFTVFGRVLPTTNQLAGTNLLHTFNTRSLSNGIVNMTSFYGEAWSAFTSLPVDYPEFRPPASRELFYVRVTELNGPSEADTTPPTVAISSPGPGEVVTNGTVTLTGTASDDREVARVLYYFGDLSPRVAAGTTNWSAVLTLRSGTNVVVAQSVDRFGNVSAPVSQTIIYTLPARVTVQVIGNGHVLGVADGDILTVGDLYTVEAKPGPGAFFSGWSGTFSSSSPRLTFRMQTNVTLIATFKSNPFPLGNGVYKGLFIATNRPAQDSAGTFTLVVSRRGAHSGGMVYRSSDYVFHGFFDSRGQEVLQGTVLGQSVTMTLSLDITEPPNRLSGTVFIGGTVASLEAYRVERRSAANTLAPVGNYTFLITGPANAAANPGGQGFGTMKMARSGRISLRGTLGDGTPLKQNAALTGGDRWPVFSRLYRNTGSILGWSRFETNRPGSFSGNLFWFRPGVSTNRYYPLGFTNTLLLRGSQYLPPGEGERVLNWTNGTVSLQGGNLQTPLLIRVRLEADDTFTPLNSPIPLTLAIDRGSGRISGSFFHPALQTDVPVEGLAVQGFALGGGTFFGPDQTGSFFIQKE
jgi:cyclophilin family peptidyl-prolyl cis-trans isomerase